MGIDYCENPTHFVRMGARTSSLSFSRTGPIKLSGKGDVFSILQRTVQSGGPADLEILFKAFKDVAYATMSSITFKHFSLSTFETDAINKAETGRWSDVLSSERP